jgi:hypothetical protein
MKKYLLFLIILLIYLILVLPAYSFSFGTDYAKTDSNFNKLAMRVYNSGSPYIYTQGAYIYNSIPVTSTASGCKLISIIRQTHGFPKPAYWNIENYKICGGNITDVENTNMAGWNNLPRDIKPVINNVIAETRQYGKATANYYGYRVIGKAQAYNGNAVYVYVLNGIKLEAIIK